VTIRIGKAFRPTELLPPGTDRRTAKGLVTTMIMDRIAALLPASQRGVYAAATADSTTEPSRTPAATEA
jgi:hypothetical protein